MIEYRGEKFSGYNKPKRTPGHAKKSHAVLAKEGDTVKLIRFGQQGVTGSPKRKTKANPPANAAKHLRNAMPLISKEVKCPPLTGQIARNGD